MSNAAFTVWEILARHERDGRVIATRVWLREFTGLNNKELDATLEKLREQKRIIYVTNQHLGGSIRVSLNIHDTTWLRSRR